MKIKNIDLKTLITKTVNNSIKKIFKKKELTEIDDLELLAKKCLNNNGDEVYLTFSFYNFHLKKFSLNTVLILRQNNENLLYQQKISNLRMLSGEENVSIIEIYKEKILEIEIELKQCQNIEDYITKNEYFPIV